jgi:hypothetical protein
MYSRYSDVSLKNGMWRKICIRDIEGKKIVRLVDIGFLEEDYISEWAST